MQAFCMSADACMPVHVQEIVKTFDRNGDGVLQIEEFIDIMVSRSPSQHVYKHE